MVTRVKASSEDNRKTYLHHGVRINFRDLGAGRPLVFIHGYGAALDTWRYLAGELSQEFRVILLDLEGHGASQRVRDSHYSLQDHAAIVTGLMEHLGVTDALLIGHSLGAAITLIIALQDIRNAMHRVSGLILIGACANPQQLALTVRLWGMPIIGWLAITFTTASFRTRLSLRRAYHDRNEVTDALVGLYAKYQRIPGTEDALRKTARRFIDSFTDSVRQELRQLQIPTIHILGEYDKVISRQAAADLCELSSHCPLTIVDGAGHLPQEEKPQEVLRLIRQFVNGR